MGNPNYVKIKTSDGRDVNVEIKEWFKNQPNYVDANSGAQVYMLDQYGQQKMVPIANAAKAFGGGYRYFKNQNNPHWDSWNRRVQAQKAKEKPAQKPTVAQNPPQSAGGANAQAQSATQRRGPARRGAPAGSSMAAPSAKPKPTTTAQQAQSKVEGGWKPTIGQQMMMQQTLGYAQNVLGENERTIQMAQDIQKEPLPKQKKESLGFQVVKQPKTDEKGNVTYETKVVSNAEYERQKDAENQVARIQEKARYDINERYVPEAVKKVQGDVDAALEDMFSGLKTEAYNKLKDSSFVIGSADYLQSNANASMKDYLSKFTPENITKTLEGIDVDALSQQLFFNGENGEYSDWVKKAAQEANMTPERYIKYVGSPAIERQIRNKIGSIIDDEYAVKNAGDYLVRKFSNSWLGRLTQLNTMPKGMRQQNTIAVEDYAKKLDEGKTFGEKVVNNIIAGLGFTSEMLGDAPLMVLTNGIGSATVSLGGKIAAPIAKAITKSPVGRWVGSEFSNLISKTGYNSLTGFIEHISPKMASFVAPMATKYGNANFERWMMATITNPQFANRFASTAGWYVRQLPKSMLHSTANLYAFSGVKGATEQIAIGDDSSLSSIFNAFVESGNSSLSAGLVMGALQPISMIAPFLNTKATRFGTKIGAKSAEILGFAGLEYLENKGTDHEVSFLQSLSHSANMIVGFGIANKIIAGSKGENPFKEWSGLMNGDEYKGISFSQKELAQIREVFPDKNYFNLFNTGDFNVERYRIASENGDAKTLAELGEMKNRYTQFFENPDISLEIKNKASLALYGTVQSNKPLTEYYAFKGKNIEFRDKDGNLIAVREFKNGDEARAIIQTDRNKTELMKVQGLLAQLELAEIPEGVDAESVRMRIVQLRDEICAKTGIDAETLDEVVLGMVKPGNLKTEEINALIMVRDGLTNIAKDVNDGVMTPEAARREGITIAQETDLVGQPNPEFVKGLQNDKTPMGKALFDGLVQGTMDRINEEAEVLFTERRFDGTVDGQKMDDSVVVVVDGNGNEMFLVGGDIKDGKVESKSGMVITVNKDGEYSHIKPEDVSIVRTESKEEHLSPIIEEMQIRVTQENGFKVEDVAGDVTSATDAPITIDEINKAREGLKPNITSEGDMDAEKAKLIADAENRLMSVPNLEKLPESREEVDELVRQGILVGDDAELGYKYVEAKYGVGESVVAEVVQTNEPIEQNTGDGSFTLPEIVLPEAKEPVGTEVGNKMPVTADGRPDFDNATPEQIVDFANEKFGEKSKGRIEASTKEAIDMESKAQKALEKAQEDANKAPMFGQKAEKAEAKLAKAKEEYNNAKAVADKWRSVLAEYDRRDEEALKAEREEKEKNEPKEVVDEATGNVIPDIVNDNPVDARKRGKVAVNGVVYERQEKTNGILGKVCAVVFGTKGEDKKAGHMKLVEADEIQESHKGQGANPMHFIPEAQPKDRTSKDSVTAAQVNSKPENFDPARLTGDGAVYSDSNPVVNTRGEVIQGNGRMMTLRNVYDNPETAKRYKEYLKEHASEFGLKPEDIDAMEKPVLVNEINVSDEEAIRLGQKTASDLESGGEQRIQAKNFVKLAGEKFKNFVNKLFNGSDEDMSLAQLIDENGVEALKIANRLGFVSNTQMVTAIKDGRLTPEAKNDILNIMKERLFDGAPQALRTQFDELPAKAQKSILATYLRDLQTAEEAQLLGDIRQSIQAYSDLMKFDNFAKATKYEGARKAINDWLAQQNMFDAVANSEKYSNFALELAARMKTTSMKDMTNIFNEYYDLVQGKQDELDFFGESTGKREPMTKEDAIKKMFNLETGEKKDVSELEGKDDVDGNSSSGEEGQSGSTGDDKSGESVEKGTESSDDRGGTEGNDVEEPKSADEDVVGTQKSNNDVEVSKVIKGLEKQEILGDAILSKNDNEVKRYLDNFNNVINKLVELAKNGNENALKVLKNSYHKDWENSDSQKIAEAYKKINPIIDSAIKEIENYQKAETKNVEVDESNVIPGYAKRVKAMSDEELLKELDSLKKDDEQQKREAEGRKAERKKMQEDIEDAKNNIGKYQEEHKKACKKVEEKLDVTDAEKDVRGDVEKRVGKVESVIDEDSSVRSLMATTRKVAERIENMLEELQGKLMSIDNMEDAENIKKQLDDAETIKNDIYDWLETIREAANDDKESYVNDFRDYLNEICDIEAEENNLRKVLETLERVNEIDDDLLDDVDDTYKTLGDKEILIEEGDNELRSLDDWIKEDDAMTFPELDFVKAVAESRGLLKAEENGTDTKGADKSAEEKERERIAKTAVEELTDEEVEKETRRLNEELGEGAFDLAEGIEALPELEKTGLLQGKELESRKEWAEKAQRLIDLRKRNKPEQTVLDDVQNKEEQLFSEELKEDKRTASQLEMALDGMMQHAEMREADGLFEVSARTKGKIEAVKKRIEELRNNETGVKLEKARKRISDLESRIKEQEKEVNKARKKYEKGFYSNNRKELKKEYSDMVKTLDLLKDELSYVKSEYNSLIKSEDSKEGARARYDDAYTNYQLAKINFDKAYEKSVEEFNEKHLRGEVSVEEYDAWAKMSKGERVPEEFEKLQNAKQKMLDAWHEYNKYNIEERKAEQEAWAKEQERKSESAEEIERDRIRKMNHDEITNMLLEGFEGKDLNVAKVLMRYNPSDIASQAKGGNKVAQTLLERIDKITNAFVEDKNHVRIEEVKRMFDLWNRDADGNVLDTDMQSLFDLVYEKMRYSGLTFRLIDNNRNLGGDAFYDGLVQYGRRYLYNPNADNNYRRNLIIHELLHTIEQHAIEIAKGNSFAGKYYIVNDKMVEAAKELLGIYEQVLANTGKGKIFDKYTKSRGTGDYGTQNAHEMVADMFKMRDKLKQLNLWERFKNGIKKFLGIDKISKEGDKQTNAFEGIRNAIDKLLDNFEYQDYQRIQIGEGKTRLRSEGETFSDKESADKFMGDGGSKRFISEETKDDAVSRLSKKLRGNIGANPFADPEVYELLGKIAAYHFESGVRKAVDLVKEVYNTLKSKQLYKNAKSDIEKAVNYWHYAFTNPDKIIAPYSDSGTLSSKVFDNINSGKVKNGKTGVFTSNYYYLCNNVKKDGRFDIVAMLPIEGNKELINNWRNEYESEVPRIFTNPEMYNSHIDEIKSRGGRVIGDILDSEGVYGGGTGELASLVGRGETESGRGIQHDGEVSDIEEAKKSKLLGRQTWKTLSTGYQKAVADGDSKLANDILNTMKRKGYDTSTIESYSDNTGTLYSEGDNSRSVSDEFVERLKNAKNKQEFVDEIDVEIARLNKLIDESRNVETLEKCQAEIDRLNQLKADVEKYGFHRGDLGKAEHLPRMYGATRSTGHFGTGTYFTGDKISGYNSRDGKEAPDHAVDFSKYNLFKPKTAEQGKQLHELLKWFNNTFFKYDTDRIKDVDSFDYMKNQAEELIDGANVVEKDGVEYLNDKDFEMLSSIAKTIYGKDYELADKTYKTANDFVSELSKQDYYWKTPRDKVKEIENYGEKVEELANVLGVKVEDIDKAVNQISKDLDDYSPFNGEPKDGNFDSGSTRLMKELGFEGVDVRGLKGLDNTDYGSVIYDLKEKDVLYRTAEGGDKVDNVEATAKHAEGVIEGLDGKGRVVRSEADMTAKDKKYFAENPKATGYYDTKTGEVVVNAERCTSRHEAERTVLHEKVGHEGLRKVLGDNFNDFLHKVWRGFDGDMRKAVSAKAGKLGWDFNTAIDEYLAEQAERFDEHSNKVMRIAKDVFNAIASKLGFKSGMTDTDVRTALWLSKNSMANKTGSLEYRIRKKAFESQLKRNMPKEQMDNNLYEFTERAKNENGDYTPTAKEVLSRTSSTPLGKSVAMRYEERINKASYLWTEAHQNALRSVQIMQEEISGGKDKVKDGENVFDALNRTMSADEAEMNEFENRYAKPFTEMLSKLLPKFDGKDSDERYDNLEKYMYAVHGLERNRVFAVRDEVNKLLKSDDPQDVALGEQMQKDFDAQRKALKQKMDSNPNYTFRDYYNDLDKWIRDNVNDEFDASKADKSGLSDESFDWSIDNGEYDEAQVLDFILDSQTKMNEVDPNATANLHKMVKEITDGILDKQYNSGITSKAERDKARDMFDWYVPLRDFKEETAEDIFNYINKDYNPLSVVGYRTADMRTSAARHPLATMIVMANGTIMQGNKNIAKAHALRLARNNKDNGLLTELNVVYEKMHDTNGNEYLEPIYPKLREGMTGDEMHQALEDYKQEIENIKNDPNREIVTERKKHGDLQIRFRYESDAEQHMIHVKVGGEDKVLFLNANPRAAQAINGLVRDKNAPVIKAVNNWLSQMSTSRSLTFIGRNKARDIEYASASMEAVEGHKYLGHFLANYERFSHTGFNKHSMKSLYKRLENGTLDMSDKIDRLFKEFVDNGGQTGYVQAVDVDNAHRKLLNIVKNNSIKGMIGKKSVSKVFGAWFDVVDGINRAVENQTRFAAYYTSRTYKNRSISRSIRDAKNASVNFNTTGAGYGTMSMIPKNESTWHKFNRIAAASSATYLKNTTIFYNAGVQGMSRTWQIASGGNKWQTAKAIASIGAVPFAIGATLPLLNMLIANNLDNDDDKKKHGNNPYAMLPEYERRQNLCLYLGHGRFAKLPLAIELRAFHGLGDLSAGAFNRFTGMYDEASGLDGVELTAPESGKAIAERYVYDVTKELAQITPTDIFGGSKAVSNDLVGGVAGLLIPSSLAPFFAAGTAGLFGIHGTNVGWTGAPVSKHNNWNEAEPEWTKAASKTKHMYTAVTHKLSDWTGGNLSEGGFVNLNPSEVEYILTQMTSSGGKDIIDLASLMYSLSAYGINKATGSEVNSDIDFGSTPVTKAFYRSKTADNSLANTRTRYYNYVGESVETKARIASYKKNKDVSVDDNARYEAVKNNEAAYRAKIVDKYNKKIKKLQHIKNTAKTPQEREDAQLEINAQMQYVVDMMDLIERNRKRGKTGNALLEYDDITTGK